MSIGAVSSIPTAQPYQPLQQVQSSSGDPDRDGDKEATESARAKANEAATPVNPNLGNTVNIKA